MLNIYFYAPVFLFCVIEYYFNSKNTKEAYSISESVSTLSIIFIKIMFSYLITTEAFKSYYEWSNMFYLSNHIIAFYRSHVLLAENNLHWILRYAVLLIFTDFAYYVWHVMNHKINLLWASHFTHHSSTKMNIIAGLRTPFDFLSIMFLTSWIIFFPILFGFSLTEVLVCIAALLSYVALTHTNIRIEYGILEFVFVSPQHHRLHHVTSHGSKAVNYAGVFSFWDRLFKTYDTEQDRIYSYGVIGFNKPGHIFEIHFYEYLKLIDEFKKVRSFKQLINKLI